MRMEKRLERLTALILAGLVLMLSAGFFIGEKKDFSENENRYLASFPHFSLERVVSGAYMEDWNSWLADHFPFRDFLWVRKRRRKLRWERRKSMEFLLRRTAI